MQWAARSIPAQRSLPVRRASISFGPTLSIDAARSRRPSSGYSPANAPKPSVPVDSAAARRRSTIDSAVASETPAASYVLGLPLKRAPSLEKPGARPWGLTPALRFYGDLQTRLPLRSSAATPAIGPVGTDVVAWTFAATGTGSAIAPSVRR